MPPLHHRFTTAPELGPSDGGAAMAALLAMGKQERWHLRFPPSLEARFEANTAAQRSRDLQAAGLLALGIFDSLLLNDWISRPEVLLLACWWRLGVATPYALLVLALVRRGLPRVWREGAIGSLLILALVAGCKLFQQTTSPDGIYDIFLFSLIFLAGNVVFQLRFACALGSSMIGLLVAAFYLFGPDTQPHHAKTYAMGLMVATALFTALACYRLERAERRNYLHVLREITRSDMALQAASRYAALADTDALTDLANRRAFDQELPRRWAHAANNGLGMAALLIDIDHFKQFNDLHGHAAGDDCLRRVACAMRIAVRDNDHLARIGGEEFAVLLQPATVSSATRLAQRLRAAVVTAGITHNGLAGQPLVTISVGFVVTGPPMLLAPDALMDAADRALYEAKRQGRNRCVRLDGQTFLPV
ncbi:GGDEF domain-containing protein [Ideonella margarita]|uniref:diguanylate cyclase n=1 Tax=Ideonella margarita TaxID=2984191 RepID=A0ABU9C2B5_9BURK